MTDDERAEFWAKVYEMPRRRRPGGPRYVLPAERAIAKGLRDGIVNRAAEPRQIKAEESQSECSSTPRALLSA